MTEALTRSTASPTSIDLGGGAHVVSTTLSGRGEGSQGPVERHLAQLATWSNGKMTSFRVFASNAEALEAARAGGSGTVPGATPRSP
jgi:hypothetical protein